MPACPSSPIYPLVDHLADLLHDEQVPAQVLIPALATVIDPRHRRGIRHPLQVILTLTMCAVIAGAKSFVAIAEWAADAPPHLLTGFGVKDRSPSESTFRRTLQQVNGDALDKVLGGWAATRTKGFHGLRLLAVDGKSVRGARIADGRCPHLLAAITHTDGVVLGQVNVDVKTNEIPMLPTLLDTIDLTRTVVTADALHAQKSHAHYLVEKRSAHYLLTVKNNQPTLRAQLAALPWIDVPSFITTEKRHGRTAERTHKVVTVTTGISFPHAQQVLQITRRSRRPGKKKWATETVYALTDLPARQASPHQLAAWIRGHWHIENKLHWVRDVTYQEDHSQIRTGHGPQVMASLRNLAITILRLAGYTNIAHATRHHARRPQRPITLLLTS